MSGFDVRIQKMLILKSGQLSMMMIIKKMMKVTMVINFFACVDSVAVKDTGRRDFLERID